MSGVLQRSEMGSFPATAYNISPTLGLCQTLTPRSYNLDLLKGVIKFEIRKRLN